MRFEWTSLALFAAFNGQHGHVGGSCWRWCSCSVLAAQRELVVVRWPSIPLSCRFVALLRGRRAGAKWTQPLHAGRVRRALLGVQDAILIVAFAAEPAQTGLPRYYARALEACTRLLRPLIDLVRLLPGWCP